MSTGARLWEAFKRAARFKNDYMRYSWAAITWIPPVIFINDNVFELLWIRGPSMSPFFNERHNETTRSDICLNWKFQAQENLQRGQIVTFRWVFRLFADDSL